MKTFFLVAAIVGAIVPWVLFLQYVGVNGLDFIAFADAVFANLAAGAFAVDLLLSSVVFWAFMIHRSRMGKGPGPGLFIALNLFIGLSCALPAYLYAQECQRTAVQA